MARSFNARYLAAGAWLLAGALLTPAAPAEAQSRMRVLVPGFENEQGKTTRTGNRLADQLRKEINQMATHAPAERKDVNSALKKHGLKESDMDCIKWAQLARLESSLNIGLVLCGTLNESANTVEARFAPVGGGDAFMVPQFTMQSIDQAAAQVVEAFGTYVRQLQLVQYCDDYIRNESWQQALDNCNQAVELNPRSVSAHYARGSALLNLDRPEEALEAYETVLEVDPIHTEALLAAGYTAAKLGRQEVSQRYLGEYLALNPGDVQVRLTIATRLANEGDPSGALKLVEEAIADEEEGTAQLYEYAGHFAMNTGLQLEQLGVTAAEDPDAYFEKAIESYEHVLEMEGDSTSGAVLRNLMTAYRNTGETDRALALGERATTVSDEPQTWNVYAGILRDAGQIDEAMRALDRVQELDPEFPNITGRKAVMFLDAGRLDEAVAATRRAAERDEMQPAQIENISQRITVQGWQHAQQKRFDRAIAHFEAARRIGQSELSDAMANFFHAVTLIQQGDPIIREANNAAAGRRAKPLFERAKALLQGAAAYTDQASKRAELLQQVDQFIEVADALIRAGR